jgi:hypothetical protein
VQKYLHICGRTPLEINGMNCTNCNKCLQIAARLEIFGVYPEFQTFKQPFSFRYYFPWVFRASLGDYPFREVSRQAVDARRWDIYILFAFVRIFASINRTFIKIAHGLLPAETRYRLKKRAYAGTPNRPASWQFPLL